MRSSDRLGGTRWGRPTCPTAPALSLLAVSVVFGLGLAVSSMAGCSDDKAALEPQVRDGGRDGTTTTLTPEQMFRALEPELKQTCGPANKGCHIAGTTANAPKWLAEPDAYVSAKAYPGVLPASGDVGDCILLTQIQHTGPALSETPKLFG